MLKLNPREMKLLPRFLFMALCLLNSSALFANVATTNGDNLTAYNGSGSINNNNWNTMMNSRTVANGTGVTNTNAKATFGNCNAVILRCAQPKCSNGGCASMDVAYPIVAGCVHSNETCSKHGDDLINSISAQLVASSTAVANQQNAMAAQMAAQQSEQQMQQMQSQMQQMQSQMQEQMRLQNEQQAQQLQMALQQQAELNNQAILDAQQQAPTVTANGQNDSVTAADGLTVAQTVAAQNGIDSEILVRQQISGQIMSAIENAQVSMKTLRATMQDVFDYAGCESNGANCRGPKRVKAFKQRAINFFEPYENVLDETYEALMLAMTVGVDVSDIVMMMNDSCNMWGQYMCESCEKDYVHDNTKKNTSEGWSLAKYNSNKHDDAVMCETMPNGGNKGFFAVKTINEKPSPKCKLLRVLADKEEVQRGWLNVDDGDTGGIRIACASDVILNSTLFKNRKKASNIDTEFLRTLIETDDTTQLGLCYAAGVNKDKLKIAKINEARDANNAVTAGYALCSIHPYNVGEKENVKDSAKRQEMNDVIALKTSLITREMKTQYDYLDATIKRLRTQLERAVLTTTLQAAGASSNGANSTTTTSVQKINGVNDCNAEESADGVISCIIGNISAILSQIETATSVTEYRKQLKNDYQIAGDWSVLYNGSSCKDTEQNTGCANIGNNKNSVKQCAQKLRASLVNCREYKNNERYNREHN